jgi:hypothetical protein
LDLDLSNSRRLSRLFSLGPKKCKTSIVHSQ